MPASTGIRPTGEPIVTTWLTLGCAWVNPRRRGQPGRSDPAEAVAQPAAPGPGPGRDPDPRRGHLADADACLRLLERLLDAVGEDGRVLGHRTGVRGDVERVLPGPGVPDLGAADLDDPRRALSACGTSMTRTCPA